MLYHKGLISLVDTKAKVKILSLFVNENEDFLATSAQIRRLTKMSHKPVC